MDDGNIDNQHGADLPPLTSPLGEQQIAAAYPPETEQAMGQDGQTGERPGAALPMPMQPSTLPLTNPIAIPADNSVLPPQVAPVQSVVPPIAEDNDLIEKEWVERAKAIVERTKNDPHIQNKEINTFKADYIHKRYNKDVKVSED